MIKILLESPIRCINEKIVNELNKMLKDEYKARLLEVPIESMSGYISNYYFLQIEKKRITRTHVLIKKIQKERK